jgi:hypothetical protein
MKSRTKLILSSAVALIVGFAAATPILIAYYLPATRVQIGVDLVYAYFGVQAFNQNVTGLWINSSDPSQRDLQIVSFFIVLNVTNRSERPADLKGFRVVAGSNVYLINTTQPSGENLTGVGSVNAIVFWQLGAGEHASWYPIWETSQSRLIALTGLVGTQSTDVINAMANEFTYLYGSADAQPYGGGVTSSAYSFKRVQLQAFGTDVKETTEFLYNAILSDNQRWGLDHNGIDVHIVTIS